MMRRIWLIFFEIGGSLDLGYMSVVQVVSLIGALRVCCAESEIRTHSPRISFF